MLRHPKLLNEENDRDFKFGIRHWFWWTNFKQTLIFPVEINLSGAPRLVKEGNNFQSLLLKSLFFYPSCCQKMCALQVNEQLRNVAKDESIS